MFVSLDDKEQRILISVSHCPAFVRNVYWIQTSVSLSRRRHQNQGVVGHTTLTQTLNRRQESCQVWIPPFQSQRLFKLISNGNRTRPNTFVLIIPNSYIFVGFISFQVKPVCPLCAWWNHALGRNRMLISLVEIFQWQLRPAYRICV